MIRVISSSSLSSIGSISFNILHSLSLNSIKVNFIFFHSYLFLNRILSKLYSLLAISLYSFMKSLKSKIFCPNSYSNVTVNSWSISILVSSYILSQIYRLFFKCGFNRSLMIDKYGLYWLYMFLVLLVISNI